ncbi:MAG: hypothetical protein ACRDHI_01265 [Actinomycetota bacterium]
MAYDGAMELVGVGVPSWPAPSTEWDWWPFLGIVLVLLVARRSLGLRLGPPVLLVAIAFGPVFAWLVDTWGAVPAIATVIGSAAVLSRLRARRMGDDPASPV